MAGATFRVDVSSITQATDDLNKVLRDLMPEVSRKLVTTGHNILYSVFEGATQAANANGGFPRAFQNHVMNSLGNATLEYSASQYSFTVGFDFESLGTWEDLERAFHQGARLRNGGQVWGSYAGETLSQPDPSRRFLYWEAIFYGEEEVTIEGRDYTVEGDWQDTQEQRISIWGNKAPEWLYLEFGQEQWVPKIPAQSVIEDFRTNFYFEGNRMMREMIDEALDIINKYKSSQISVGPVYANGKLTQSRLLSSLNAGAGPSGRARQPGQFYFG